MSEALRKAAAAVIARWDSPDWKDGTHTADYINALRAALAEPEHQPCGCHFVDGDGGRLNMHQCDFHAMQFKSMQSMAAALAEPEQSEAVAYQYRWTNPDNLQHVHPSETEWKPVELKHCKTIPEEVALLERYRDDGKPTYEVRKLYAAPPRREPLNIQPPNTEGSTMCVVRWMAETPHGWVGSYDREALEQFNAIGGEE